MDHREIFRISEMMADEIKKLGLSGPTSKVLLALMYLDERRPRVVWDLQADHWIEAEKHAAVSEFRALGLAPDSGSSRFLRRPVDALHGTGLFDFLEVSPNGKIVSWEFSSFARELQSGEVYGFILAEDIALCSSALDAIVLTQSAVRMNMKWPAFRLYPFEYPSAVGSAELSPDLSSMFKARDMTKGLEPALMKWAQVKKVEYFVEYMQQAGFWGYTEVIVRMRHDATQWSHSLFSKAQPRSRSYTVCASRPEPEGV